MNKKTKEIITTVALVLVLILMMQPFGLWMSLQTSELVLAVSVLMLVMYAHSATLDSGADEREKAIEHKTAKLAYFAGLFTLLVVASVQIISGMPSFGVLVSLVVMVSVRLMSSLYYAHKM